ncbi:partial Phosphoglycerate kinase, partial [Rhodocyclaceae bacterium]
MSKPLRAALLAAAIASAPALAADKVKIGFLSTLSGPGAGLGVDIRDGFQLAVNSLGGKVGGLPAEVIVADDCVGEGVAKVVRDLREGQVLLLENLRFHPQEEA